MITNKEAEALKDEGNKLVGRQNWPAAAKKYKKAIALNKSSAVYWSNLAFCYDKMDSLDEYLAVAQTCVKVDPSFMKGYLRLARAHHRVWGYTEEKKVLTRGLALYPHSSELKEMLLVVEEKLLLRDGIEELVIKAPSDDEKSPILFGGLPPERIEEIVRSNSMLRSKFLGIKRQPLPPISKKHEDLAKFNEHIRPVIRSFYNGELKVKWLCSGFGFTVEGYIPDESVPVIVLHVIKGGLSFSTTQHPKYDKILTVDQKLSLQFVLIKRFLREAGCRLVECALPEDELFEMSNGLNRHFQKDNMYEDSVDWRLTIADIMLGMGFKDTNTAIAQFAEDLETDERYTEAANIYAELCEDGVFNGEGSYGLRLAKTYAFAGLAFKRAHDYVSAERHYHASLREEGCNWKWTHPPENEASLTLQNMMIFYDVVSHAYLSGLNADEAHEKIQRAGFVLAGLLSCAGCITPKSDLFDHASEFKKSIKTKFRKKHKAFDAVIHATTAPTIEEYHKRLFNCQGGQLFSFAIMNDEAEAHAGILKQQKMISKSSARKYRAEEQETQFGWYCSGCNAFSVDKNIKQCPCKTVFYCSKDCQTKHWLIHKRACTNRKKKKQTN
ncbi:hypothetical protein ACHAXR_012687 [Thalassiosira sp. AJA248-18]